MDTVDIVNLNGCVIRDEHGLILARLEESDGVVRVKRMTSCSLGMYLFLLCYLREMGVDAV